MKDETTLKKKKLMAIVIMTYIMTLTTIVMAISISIEYHYDGDKTPIHYNPVDDTEVDALTTFFTPESVNLYVSTVDLANPNYGESGYDSIDGEEAEAKVVLDSYGDTTVCKYNIIYTPEYNDFENKYEVSEGVYNTLNNQIMLQFDGYDMSNNQKVSKAFDLVDITEETILFEDLVISNDEEDSATNIAWNIKLSFRNYREYNQANNTNKSVKGGIIFQMTECERTK